MWLGRGEGAIQELGGNATELVEVDWDGKRGLAVRRPMLHHDFRASAERERRRAAVRRDTRGSADENQGRGAGHRARTAGSSGFGGGDRPARARCSGSGRATSTSTWTATWSAPWPTAWCGGTRTRSTCSRTATSCSRSGTSTPSGVSTGRAATSSGGGARSISWVTSTARRVLANGNVLVFDNGLHRQPLKKGDPMEISSFEVPRGRWRSDPRTGEIVLGVRRPPAPAVLELLRERAAAAQRQHADLRVADRDVLRGDLRQGSSCGSTSAPFVVHRPAIWGWSESKLLFQAHRYGLDFAGFAGKDLGPSASSGPCSGRAPWSPTRRRASAAGSRRPGIDPPGSP